MSNESNNHELEGHIGRLEVRRVEAAEKHSSVFLREVQVFLHLGLLLWLNETYIMENNLLHSKFPGLNVILISMARLVLYQVSDCHDLVNLTHKFKHHLVISIIIHINEVYPLLYVWHHTR